MLNQFILSVSKESIAVRVILLFKYLLRFCYFSFCLDAKGGAKNGGKPKCLRASCHPRTTTVMTALVILFLLSEQHDSVLLYLFEKAMPFL
jgi:hypothetical protein